MESTDIMIEKFSKFFKTNENNLSLYNMKLCNGENSVLGSQSIFLSFESDKVDEIDSGCFMYVYENEDSNCYLSTSAGKTYSLNTLKQNKVMLVSEEMIDPVQNNSNEDNQNDVEINKNSDHTKKCSLLSAYNNIFIASEIPVNNNCLDRIFQSNSLKSTEIAKIKDENLFSLKELATLTFIPVLKLNYMLDEGDYLNLCDDKWCAFDLSVKVDFILKISKFITSENQHHQNVSKQGLFEFLSVYDHRITQHIFKLYGKSDNSNASGVFVFNIYKACYDVYRYIFSTLKSIEYEKLDKIVVQCLPDGVDADIEAFKKLATLRKREGVLYADYLPVFHLESNSKAKIKQLFSVYDSWTFDQLLPYFDDNMEECKASLLKHTFTQKIGNETYYKLKPGFL